ncbi:MAG: hypothetical protein ACI81L_002995 [Verrucomicrobiales bacterium]|jgi:hypothetical protein
MRFVGATVDELLKHGESVAAEDDVSAAADDFLASLQPIGDSFHMPWKFNESLEVLEDWLPPDLRDRLTRPGGSKPENHLEACVVALALEAGVRLQPLTKGDMQRLQHIAQHATRRSAWGRQSSYPWDTVATADIESYDFFALFAPT